MLVALLGCVTAAAPAAGAQFHWGPPVSLVSYATAGDEPAPDDVFCPSIHLCVTAPGLAVSLAPTAPGGAWQQPASRAFSSFSISTIACPSAQLCIGGGGAPGLQMSTDPAAGAPSWHSASTVGLPRFGLDAIVCPSTRTCVAGGFATGMNGAPRVYTSTDTASRWARADARLAPCRPDDPVCSPYLACPATTLCVAMTPDGVAYASTHPGNPRRAWRRTAVEPPDDAQPIVGLSCPTVHLCATADGDGRHVFVTHDPGAARPRWRTISVGFDTDELACPLANLCIANQDDAFPFVTNTPLGPAALWHPETIDPEGAITAVACPSAAVCVAVDDTNHAVTGTALIGATR